MALAPPTTRPRPTNPGSLNIQNLAVLKIRLRSARIPIWQGAVQVALTPATPCIRGTSKSVDQETDSHSHCVTTNNLHHMELLELTQHHEDI